MKKQNVLGLMLATSLAVTSLAGCNVPGMTGKAGNLTANQPGVQQPATTKPGGNTATGGQAATGGNTAIKPGTGSAAAPAPAEAKEGTAEALSDEKDMEAYDYMAGEAEADRTVMMVGAERPAEGMVGITSAVDLKAGKGDVSIRGTGKAGFKGKLADEVRKKLKDREGKKAEKLKDRLEKLKGDRAKLHEKAKGGKWLPTEPADGTEYKSFELAVNKTVTANGKTSSFSRAITMKRVRNIETKDLVSSNIEFMQTLPGGLTRASTRSKVLNADGTYSVEFNSTVTFPNGGTRVAQWSKTIAVDGTVTGTGTIVWTKADGTVKTVTITLNGTEEDTSANAGGTTVDGDAPEAAEGTQAEEAATEAETPDATEADDATKAEDGDEGDDDATEAADASDDGDTAEGDDAATGDDDATEA